MLAYHQAHSCYHFLGMIQNDPGRASNVKFDDYHAAHDGEILHVA